MRIWGNIVAHAEAQGRSLPLMDSLIAAPPARTVVCYRPSYPTTIPTIGAPASSSEISRTPGR